ncbi:MAG TPA: beta-glucosidase [bacterium]|nr:beta-glucosidase [bacterium]
MTITWRANTIRIFCPFIRIVWTGLVLSASLPAAWGQLYKDSHRPVEERVEDLLSRMTLEEKFRQLFMNPEDIEADFDRYRTGIFGLQFHSAGEEDNAAGQMFSHGSGSGAYSTAVRINEWQRFFRDETRLGIPIIPFDEALHGLVREGATAFPQSIALAATWNTELMRRVAEAIAAECRTRGIRQVLSPVVNIAADVRWGRTEETYGEDPFLSAEMGAAFVSEFEKAGVITTPKHFAANVGDGGRDSYPVHWNERLMREIILPPFKACIQRGGSRSIMTAYNSWDGTPCTANDRLLNRLLKNEWGFEGFVISDAGATGGANVLHFTAEDYSDAAARALAGGLDVIFQTDYSHHTLFTPPFYDGRISGKTIDEAVARVLRLKFELGLFDNPYVDPDSAARTNGHAAHRRLARQAARESMVLLKNQNSLLPISRDIRSIAVIGPDALEARLGGYSGPGIEKVNILEGIQKAVHAGVAVKYAEGCRRVIHEHVTVPASALSCLVDDEKQEGLRGEYFSNIHFSGKPVLVRVDRRVDFQWTLFSPDPKKLTYDFYSVRWKGKLKAPETGRFQIGIDGNDGYRLFLNDSLILDQWVKRTRQTCTAGYFFEEGKEYDIRIEFYEPAGNAWFHLIWNIGIDSGQNEKIEQAVELAENSDVAVVAAGIEEGEFRDRAYLGLPGRQEELITRVAATGTPVVVLLVGGSAVTMSRWMDRVEAIVHAWYSGEEGGNAVADILFGGYNPAGRLPVTFPVFEGQLPLVYNHKPTGRGDDYIHLTGQPLFPFGYGLSYTDFAYSDMQFSDNEIMPGDSVCIRFKVTNTGTRAGDEVVQLYLRDELASVARPVRELKGFRRIHLQPGQTREIEFIIGPETLSMLDKNLEKVIEPGRFRIMIGASSKDIRLREILQVVDQ